MLCLVWVFPLRAGRYIESVKDTQSAIIKFDVTEQSET